MLDLYSAISERAPQHNLTPDHATVYSAFLISPMAQISRTHGRRLQSSDFEIVTLSIFFTFLFRVSILKGAASAKLCLVTVGYENRK